MDDMESGDEFAEFETSGAEFDAMWAEGEPVAVAGGDRVVATTYGTLHVLHNAGLVMKYRQGVVATLTSRRAEPALVL